MSELVEFKVGDLVNYYREGWRAGYIEAIDEYTIDIRPIVLKGSSKPRTVIIPICDIKSAE